MKNEEAMLHYRQAIQINPNYSIVYTWMAHLLGASLGRYDEAFAMLETALRLDPLSYPANMNYAFSLYQRNRLDEVEIQLEKIASIYPGLYALLRGYLTPPGGNGANGPLGHLDNLRSNPGRVELRNYLFHGFAILGLEKEALAISGNQSSYALRILGRTGDAVTVAEARLAEDPTSPRGRYILATGLSSVGDYARARPMLEELWQLSDGRVTTSIPFTTKSAAALIAIRRDGDADADVSDLIAAIRDNVRRYHEAGITGADEWYGVDFEAGLADYLAGEREKGLALIAEGVEDGYFIWPREAFLQVLYDDPDFAPIMAMQEAWQARERNKFLAIVCTDNPYADVWQPEDGTCERFAAQGGE